METLWYIIGAVVIAIVSFIFGRHKRNDGGGVADRIIDSINDSSTTVGDVATTVGDVAEEIGDSSQQLVESLGEIESSIDSIDGIKNTVGEVGDTVDDSINTAKRIDEIIRELAKRKAKTPVDRSGGGD